MAIHVSPAQAAMVIDRFVQGRGGPYDWDNFTSVPCIDPAVEAARLRCIAIRNEYPAEHPGEYCSSRGIEVLRELASSLREHAV